jgi:hypothetical protein
MKFPKTLYVKVGDGGTGPDFLLPCGSVVEAAEMGKSIRVGVYTLAETTEVKGVAITNTASKTVRKRR